METCAICAVIPITEPKLGGDINDLTTAYHQILYNDQTEYIM